MRRLGIFFSVAHLNPTERLLLGAWLLILALIPFHAVLSTWGGTSIGPLEVWKSWKEILLLITLVASLGYLIATHKLKAYFSDKLVWLIFAYVGVHLLTWAWFRPDQEVALAGLLMNLRFLGIFLLTGVILTFVKPEPLLRLGLAVVLTGGMGVIFFGLLQATILPDDFLRHFGYSKETIAPFVTLDDNQQIIRLQSTLRGPNPLGQYLIIIALLLVALWNKQRRLFVAGWLLALSLLLLSSYSRSAWIGMGVAAGVYLLLWLKDEKLRRLAVAGLVGAMCVGGVILATLVPRSTFLQQTVLHNKSGDTDAGSTVEHYKAAERSLGRFVDHPFGQGPGAAGPASFYGDTPRIPENYYLQIAEEVGVVGIVLFAAINAVVIARLWRHRQVVWAAVWLASFAGISVVNLFLHGWADDTIAIIWWALTPLLMGVAHITIKKS